MWKSILFKEWLKLRWILAICAAAGIAVIASIFFNLKHDISFSGATNYWYSILFMGNNYFLILKYIPLLIGLAVGVAQYFPETVNKRIKLSFHLPVEENRLLIIMMLSGTICLLMIFSIIFLLFWMVSIHFLPFEIVGAAVTSIIPWFLAGFVVYYFIGLVVLEPVWKYWILYGLIGYASLDLFLEAGIPGSAEPAVWKFLVMTLLLSTSLLFSANRFRKGEM